MGINVNAEGEEHYRFTVGDGMDALVNPIEIHMVGSMAQPPAIRAILDQAMRDIATGILALHPTGFLDAVRHENAASIPDGNWP